MPTMVTTLNLSSGPILGLVVKEIGESGGLTPRADLSLDSG